MTGNRLLKISLAVLLIVAASVSANAQKVGIKTNLLYWGTTTPNLGAEWAVAPKLTLDLAVTGNPWKFGNPVNNRKVWHWMAQPGVRFWHREAFNRGFWGVHAITGSFDAGGIKLPFKLFPDLESHRYEGWMAGVGIEYGWQWYIGPRWNLEASLGVGYLFLQYNRFDSPVSHVMDMVKAGKHYIGPTRIGVSFMYLLGAKRSGIPQPYTGAFTERSTIPTSTPETSSQPPYTEQPGYTEPLMRLPEPTAPPVRVTSPPVIMGERPRVEPYEPTGLPPVRSGSAYGTYNRSRGVAPDTLVISSGSGSSPILVVVVVPENGAQGQSGNYTVIGGNSQQLSPAKNFFAISGNAYLDFGQGSSLLSPDYMDNREQLAEIRRRLDGLMRSSSARVIEITITGYASPEGVSPNNAVMAAERARSLAEYLRSLYGISVVPRIISAGEDWTGLRAMVEGSNLRERGEILSIIDSREPDDAKESRLRRMRGRVWRTLEEEFFPALRRVEYKIDYEVVE